MKLTGRNVRREMKMFQKRCGKLKKQMRPEKAKIFLCRTLEEEGEEQRRLRRKNVSDEWIRGDSEEPSESSDTTEHSDSLWQFVGKRKRQTKTLKEPSIERRNLHKFFERLAELAVRGENAAQKRFSEAATEREIKDWEKRSSEIALYESQRELESQRMRLHQANQWAD